MYLQINYSRILPFGFQCCVQLLTIRGDECPHYHKMQLKTKHGSCAIASVIPLVGTKCILMYRQCTGLYITKCCLELLIWPTLGGITHVSHLSLERVFTGTTTCGVSGFNGKLSGLILSEVEGVQGQLVCLVPRAEVGFQTKVQVP